MADDKDRRLGAGGDEGDEDDEDEGPWTEIVRAKWSMDGARTLTEAAEQLREYAAWLEELERDGWQLIDPVDDDYGFMTNVDPAKRLSVEVDLTAALGADPPAAPPDPTASP